MAGRIGPENWHTQPASEGSAGLGLVLGFVLERELELRPVGDRPRPPPGECPA
jgi:hypothetical protein